MKFAVQRLRYSAHDARVLMEPVVKAQEGGSHVQTSMEGYLMRYSDGHLHAHVRSRRIRRVLARHRRRRARALVDHQAPAQVGP